MILMLGYKFSEHYEHQSISVFVIVESIVHAKNERGYDSKHTKRQKAKPQQTTPSKTHPKVTDTHTRLFSPPNQSTNQ